MILKTQQVRERISQSLRWGENRIRDGVGLPVAAQLESQITLQLNLEVWNQLEIEISNLVSNQVAIGVWNKAARAYE